ncbi:hypothetical protein VPNG_07522 [Cytospora leucostoma]|uniref:F-box domain-containing protein n=1 Tax=Cytospora leucostoma TaxID=1230097 RepID=A0A423WS92_9PEZI|nr:hypothetical protein VPNG_07522 [Cytospora leucostoma]
MDAALVWKLAMAILALTVLGISMKHYSAGITSTPCTQASQRQIGSEIGVLPPEPPHRLHFLALPAEIRVAIYRHVFAEDDCIMEQTSSFGRPALTQVNRLIRLEALAVYLAETRLVIRIPEPRGCNSNPNHIACASDRDLGQRGFDHGAEFQRWMAKLDHLRLFASSGNMHHVKSLEISMGPVFVLDDGRKRFTTIRYFRCRHESVKSIFERFLLMSGYTRIGDDDTNWNDVDAVREALETATQALKPKLQRLQSSTTADVEHPTPVGGLAEVMHALFGGYLSSKVLLLLG